MAETKIQLAKYSDIPTKVSQLTNDSDYLYSNGANTTGKLTIADDTYDNGFIYFNREDQDYPQQGIGLYDSEITIASNNYKIALTSETALGEGDSKHYLKYPDFSSEYQYTWTLPETTGTIPVIGTDDCMHLGNNYIDMHSSSDNSYAEFEYGRVHLCKVTNEFELYLDLYDTRGLRLIDHGLDTTLTAEHLDMTINNGRIVLGDAEDVSFNETSGPGLHLMNTNNSVRTDYGVNGIDFGTTNGDFALHFPEKTGTIALVSDLNNYLPLSGGTMTGKINISTGEGIWSSLGGFSTMADFPAIYTDDGSIYVTTNLEDTEEDSGYWFTFPEQSGTLALVGHTHANYLDASMGSASSTVGHPLVISDAYGASPTLKVLTYGSSQPSLVLGTTNSTASGSLKFQGGYWGGVGNANILIKPKTTSGASGAGNYTTTIYLPNNPNGTSTYTLATTSDIKEVSTARIMVFTESSVGTSGMGTYNFMINVSDTLNMWGQLISSSNPTIGTLCGIIYTLGHTSAQTYMPVTGVVQVSATNQHSILGIFAPAGNQLFLVYQDYTSAIQTSQSVYNDYLAIRYALYGSNGNLIRNVQY